MLAEIKRYLKQRQTVSLYDLALRFDAEPEAMRGMLEVWLRKGRVRRLPVTGGSACASGCGGGCSTCAVAGPESEWYTWVGDAKPAGRVVWLRAEPPAR
jgi:putative ferrous iron transport protein C